jgi:hypothetical protein
MDTRWQLHSDGISRRDIPALYDNRHNAGLSNELAVRIATEHGRGQAFCKRVNLPAGIAQAGDFYHSLVSELQQRSGWQRQEVETARCHVLTDIACANLKLTGAQLIEQFFLYQMDLPQIRRVWISPRVKEMLHSMAIVRISFDAKAGNQPDRQHVGFAERVFRVAAHCSDKRSHVVRSRERGYMVSD